MFRLLFVGVTPCHPHWCFMRGFYFKFFKSFASSKFPLIFCFFFFFQFNFADPIRAYSVRFLVKFSPFFSMRDARGLKSTRRFTIVKTRGERGVGGLTRPIVAVARTIIRDASLLRARVLGHVPRRPPTNGSVRRARRRGTDRRATKTSRSRRSGRGAQGPRSSAAAAGWWPADGRVGARARACLAHDAATGTATQGRAATQRAHDRRSCTHVFTAQCCTHRTAARRNRGTQSSSRTRIYHGTRVVTVSE